MTFEDPIWLILTPLLALFSAGLVGLGWRKRGHLLSQFAASRLLEDLTEKASFKRRLTKSILLVAAVTTLALALARPQYGVEWTEQKARGLDIVFALDSSKSMLATDLRPTRLERAKLAILDLIDRLESDRIGLVAFAGQAFLQTPPTLDYSAFNESLDATDPSILSRGGSDLGRAIEEAAKAFPTENNVKVVVLLTDGEDLGGNALEAARTAADNGIQIFTIGIGTPEGEYLRVKNAQGIEEFLRDNNGQPVRSQLDENTLQQIAQITNGRYVRLSSGSLNTLYDSVLSTLPREERESELQEIRIERFQWLLAAALIFLMVEVFIHSRKPGRGQGVALLLSLFVITPHPTEAGSFDEANSAIQEGNYAKANELYSEAIQQTENIQLQRDALYNMGHATYQLGRSTYDSGDPKAALEQLKSAEELFESALELDPSDPTIQEDAKRARAVREAVEKLLEQQQQQQDQQDQEQEGSDSDQQQDQNKDQQEGDQQQENQNESGEQQEQDQQGQDQQNQQSEHQEQESNSEEQSESESGEDGSESQEQEQEGQQEEQTSGQSGEDDSEENGEQQAPGEEDPQQADEEQQQQVPEVQESGEEPGEAQSGSAASAQEGVPLEGMTLKDAQRLLDSLKGKEEILPFTKPTPGEGRPLQDW